MPVEFNATGSPEPESSAPAYWFVVRGTELLIGIDDDGQRAIPLEIDLAASIASSEPMADTLAEANASLTSKALKDSIRAPLMSLPGSRPRSAAPSSSSSHAGHQPSLGEAPAKEHAGPRALPHCRTNVQGPRQVRSSSGFSADRVRLPPEALCCGSAAESAWRRNRLPLSRACRNAR